MADGNLENCRSTGFEDTAYLTHRERVIRDVLEHMVTDHQIELRIRKLNMGNVDLG